MTKLEKIMIAVCVASIISSGVCVFVVTHNNNSKYYHSNARSLRNWFWQRYYDGDDFFDDMFDNIGDDLDNIGRNIEKTVSQAIVRNNKDKLCRNKNKLNEDKNIVTQTTKLSAAEYSFIIDNVGMTIRTANRFSDRYSSNNSFCLFGTELPSVIVDATGKDNQISLTTDKNISDEVKFVVDEKAKTIKLTGKEGRRYDFSKFEIKLQTKVNKVELNGDYRLDFNLGKMDAFALKIDGSVDGKIKADITKDFKCEINGSGSVSLDGNAENLDIKVDGSGEVSANNFKTQSAVVEIEGSGDCEVCASKSLKVDITGDGKVLYSGDPQVEKNIFGSGSVEKQ
ncbi:hypothetical protein FACS189481_4440 [Clostridia bacterium]|nr:hypothetical protein FACS189481_4440 [Clostridia bacterium]